MSDDLPDWNPFYTMIATAAVTALALIFVAYQLRETAWLAQERKRVTMWAALGEFWVPLILSLISLMPYPNSWRVGGVVGGVIGVIVLSYFYTKFYRGPTVKRFGVKLIDSNGDRFDQLQLEFCVISLVLYPFVLITSVLSFWHGMGWLRSAIAGICIWLILSGLFESWLHFNYAAKEKSIADDKAANAVTGDHIRNVYINRPIWQINRK